jgi:hypothetical protein
LDLHYQGIEDVKDLVGIQSWLFEEGRMGTLLIE